MTQVSARLASLSPSATLAMSQKSGELKAQGVDVINLSVGEPDFNTPECIKDGAKAGLDANLTHYPDANGSPELRQAISEYEAAHNDLHYDPDEIILTVGATEAVFAAVYLDGGIGEA